jgi:hypothetical protein
MSTAVAGTALTILELTGASWAMEAAPNISAKMKSKIFFMVLNFNLT